MFRIVIISAGLIAAAFAVLIFSGKVPIGKSTTAVTGDITVWGTIPQEQMDSYLQHYNPAAKTYRVNYKFIKESDFSDALVNALADGTGPDAILAPYQIILEQMTKVYPYPQAYLSEKAYRDAYVNGASVLYSSVGALALPVSIEPMVLFYNRTLLAKHNVINPPAYWDEVTNLAPTLTVPNSSGSGFSESAIALGASNNVPYTKDIIATIIEQLGQDVAYKQQGGGYTVTANKPVKEGDSVLPLATTLRYIMEFSDPTKTKYSWTQFMPPAQDQFVAEKLAMYIGYFGDYQTIKARNPRMDFDMVMVPQTRGYNTLVTGMRLYGFATLRTTKNPRTALQVETDFASLSNSEQIASLIGGVPALKSYLTTPGVNDVIAKSNLVARGWYDIRPENSSSIFDRMISDVLSGRADINDAAESFVSRLQDLYTSN